jgi:hypothetical protein
MHLDVKWERLTVFDSAASGVATGIRATIHRR